MGMFNHIEDHTWEIVEGETPKLMRLGRISGINEIFLESIFRLMPAIVGVTIWKGKKRCGRDPAYTMNEVPKGTFQELVTVSDMAFLVWGYCNYIDDIKLAPVTTTSNESEVLANINGKFTQPGATNRYAGWSQEGQDLYNNTHRVIKAQLNSSLSVTENSQVGSNNTAAKLFVLEFEARWRATYGVNVVGHLDAAGASQDGAAGGVELDLAQNLIGYESDGGEDEEDHLPGSQLTEHSAFANDEGDASVGNGSESQAPPPPPPPAPVEEATAVEAI